MENFTVTGLTPPQGCADRHAAMYARRGSNRKRRDASLARALELFDLTPADERWRGPRRRELLRAREEVCRLSFGDDVPPDSAASLRVYFPRFAVAARSR